METTIQIVIEGNTLYIGNECSSGCKYNFETVDELKQTIHDYVDDYIDYELEESK